MKKLPYWLKGGIIFALFFTIIFLGLMKLGDMLGAQGLIVIFPIGYISMPGGAVLSILFFSDLGSLEIPALITANIIIYFITGTFLGFLYGKFKNRGKRV